MTVPTQMPPETRQATVPQPVSRGTEHASCASALTDLRGASTQLRRHIPDVYKGFGALHDAALAPGALTTLTKELIALTLAVKAQCDGCIAAHAKALARLGASEEQVAEAIGVVLLMDGGPATVYGPRALATFQEFAAAAT